MTKRIVIIGDSHTDAIKRAIKNKLFGDIKNVDISAYRYLKEKNGTKIGDLSEDEVDAMVSELNPSDLLVSTIGGNQHQVVSLIQHPIKFDICTSRLRHLRQTHSDSALCSTPRVFCNRA